MLELLYNNRILELFFGRRLLPKTTTTLTTATGSTTGIASMTSSSTTTAPMTTPTTPIMCESVCPRGLLGLPCIQTNTTSLFKEKGIHICAPDKLYFSENVSKCVFDMTWKGGDGDEGCGGDRQVGKHDDGIRVGSMGVRSATPLCASGAYLGVLHLQRETRGVCSVGLQLPTGSYGEVL
jgi:hypothetical protein